ncbi:MAG: SPFH/Band 7/PHB domain protein [Bacteroidales bacterium]|nr:SPFH/Band 7/PHB domain protein [Bacteroidales bacterium]
MEGIGLVLGIIVLIVVLFVLSGIKVIQQSETKIVERLGKYHATLPSGVNIIWPIIDKPRKVYIRKVVEGYDGRAHVIMRQSDKIDLREQVFDFPKQSVITKDNVTTTVNALLYFQITDPVKAVYEIDNLPYAIEKLTQTTLRNVIGELELDQTLTSRDTINSKLRAVLDEASNKWGVKVNRVELQDITPPNSVRDAMEQQMQAERERRAKVLKASGDKEKAILESEGLKAAQINRAEAEKQTKILQAQGIAEAKVLQANAEAEAIERIANAVKESNMSPANYMLADKYIATLKEMVTGKDNKTVYLPYDASSVLSSIGCIKEMFNK